MKVIYSTAATVVGGREGRARSDDGALDVTLARPTALGGTGRAGTNPEQLFAAGYAACFESAVRFVAGQEKKQISTSSVTARVSVGPRETGGFQLAVALEISLGGVTWEEARSLAETAHARVCPYSNATRGNIEVQLTVKEPA